MLFGWLVDPAFATTTAWGYGSRLSLASLARRDDRILEDKATASAEASRKRS